MLMIHAETTINDDFNNSDIIKLYTIDNDLRIKEEYFNYDYETALTILPFNDNHLNKPKFQDVAINTTKELLENNQPLIVLNYLFMKNSLSKYGINIDNYQIIDISNTFKKLELFGNEFKYSLNNIIEYSNISSKENREKRGEHMLELFNILNRDLNLSLDQLIHINYHSNNTTFDTLNNKYSGQNLSDISSTVLLNLLTFENLNMKLNNSSLQEIKFSIIKHLLENNNNVINYDLKNITNKEEFDNKIKDIFEISRIYNIDNNKLNTIYNMCDIYYKTTHNQIDIEDIKIKFNELDQNNIEEISF